MRNCEVCKASVDDVALFRANPKGEVGRWRCEGCLDSPPPEDVTDITDLFYPPSPRDHDGWKR